MNSQETISGAYATLPSHKNIDPLRIEDPEVRSVHEISYKKWALIAGILAANTFRAKGLARSGDLERFQYVIDGHLRLLGKIARPDQKTAVALGPYGDCYKPREAPGVNEGADYWESIFITLLKSRERIDIVLPETINSLSELIGIFRAWKRLEKQIRGRFELITSLIPSPDHAGHLYSGEPLADVANALRSETGSLAQLGLNCFPILQLEPALAALVDKSIVRVVYTNTADGNPGLHEGSEAAVRSHTAEEVSDIWSSMREKFQRKFPTLVIGECCGTDFERIGVIAKTSKSRLETGVPVA